ncbi:MAG: polyhydroxybutyrate depolymerase [Alphaproteobacteria bacterium]|nr:polyhydroxybutyrate depolymerase [Alphaproteobacteria bacterium]MCB9974651.1 polyhydroxybutyrate depolymerase [Rhodospirillales bacterium]
MVKKSIILAAFHLLALILVVNLTAVSAQAWDKKKSKDQTEIEYTIEHDGVKRTYNLHIPAKIADNTNKVPLIIVLHGGGGNSDNGEKMTRFSEKADREGFIVAYPSGSGRLKRNILKTWNFWHCCGYAMRNNTDDIGFIGKLIDTLIKNYPVDPKRVLITGMSNGAMMSHRAGIELSKKIAVIAPVVGTMFGDEPEARSPVAALIINGTKDTQIKIEGGQNNSRFKDAWDGTPMKPALWQSQYWAKNNGCKPTPKKTSIKPSVILYDYECPKGYDVRHIILENGTHSWPGGRKGYKNGADPTTEINATDEIWAFLIEMTG